MKSGNDLENGLMLGLFGYVVVCNLEGPGDFVSRLLLVVTGYYMVIGVMNILTTSRCPSKQLQHLPQA